MYLRGVKEVARTDLGDAWLVWQKETCAHRLWGMHWQIVVHLIRP